MSLKMLLTALQAGPVGSVVNVLVQVVHCCIEEFSERDKKQDADIAAVKEMVARLEDRVNERVEGVRAASSRETELVAKALEVVVRRVGNLEVDPR
jgi:hypothetical protein